MGNIDRSGTLKDCVICGHSTGVGYRTCKSCAERWNLIGKPYKDWPRWIVELVKIERRNAYREANYPEIPIDPQILERILDNEQGNLV